MRNYLPYLFDKSLKLWACLFLLPVLLSNCSAPTSSLDSPQEAVVVTKTTPIMTATTRPVITEIQPTRMVTMTSTVLPQPTDIPTAFPQPTVTNTATPTPSPWALKELGDGFLFEGNKNNLAGIYLMQIDGVSKFIAKGEMLGGQPVSLLGNKFVFDSENQGVSYEKPGKFALVDLTSGLVTPIELLAQTDAIYWAPDESEFIYFAGKWENHLIRLISYDIETSTNNILYEFAMEDAPAYTNFNLIGFSPDGAEIAFIAKLNGQYDLYTFNVQEATIIQWTDTTEIELLAEWSPIANHLLLGTLDIEEAIAFASWPHYSQYIELIDRSGNRTPLLEDILGITTASWSLDGQQVAYSRDGVLCIMEISTQVERCPQLEGLSTVAWRTSAKWSANGEWLAVRVISTGFCFQLYMIELETTSIIGHDKSCEGSSVYWVEGSP